MEEQTKNPSPQPQNFINRRKQYRLPFEEKVVFTDGKESNTAHAGNISRGGVFVLTLTPYPIDTNVRVAFMLPNHPTTICIEARVAHVVFDNQRCEVDCGIGFQFTDISNSIQALLNNHILNEKMSYLELKKLLQPEKPNMLEVQRYLEKMPHLKSEDLMVIRYRVNRICTLFENPQGLEDSPELELPKVANG